MQSILRQIRKLVNVAAVLLVITQPLLAADCSCCVQQDEGSGERRSEERKTCSKRCCNHKSETQVTSSNARTEGKPCRCPSECPCHLRHIAKVVVDRIDEADQYDVLGQTVSYPNLYLTTYLVHGQVLPAETNRPRLRTVISSKEFCARICRLTI